MASKRNDVFVLGEESLGDVLDREEATPAPERSATPLSERCGRQRSAGRPLAAAGLGTAAVALFAVLASRGGADRRAGEATSSPRDRVELLAKSGRGRVGARWRENRAPRGARRDAHSEKLRPIRPQRRPGGGREREPTGKLAPIATPQDAPVPAPVTPPAPVPASNPPAPPSPPRASGGGSGRGPEFGFER